MVVTHDGCGATLPPIVKYCDSKEADAKCQQFVKRASSTTGIKGMKQPNDCFYKFIKATFKKLQKKFHDVNQTNKELLPGYAMAEDVLEDYQLPPVVFSYFEDIELHTKFLVNLFYGTNATSNINT